MSDIAISVKNLSKQYRIGQLQRNKTLRDTLTDAMYTTFHRLSQLMNGQSTINNHQSNNTIWALKDVSFDVNHGEVVGIIGHNGAGKSTLLKILTRITEPTEGYADIYGRVGSLLEVGTGFHSELTGRENIYLSGAILGMKKAEIDRKFDEIVAFAEIEKFLDTPVKRYSSGMYVRLAFAVAAHLEPEILIIDEVLAVGDAAFQKKCLGKMNDVARYGRTVLFVSHNMIAVKSLCQRAIWLQNGHIRELGESARVVSHYLRSNGSQQTERVWDNIETAPGNDIVRLRRLSLRADDGSSSDLITMHTPFIVEVEFWNLVPDTYLNINLHVITEEQIIAFSTSSERAPVWHAGPFPVGLFRSICHVPGNFLNSGLHRISLLVIKDLNELIYRLEDALSVEVMDLEERHYAWYGKGSGVLSPMLEWTTECIDSGFQVTQTKKT